MGKPNRTQVRSLDSIYLDIKGFEKLEFEEFFIDLVAEELKLYIERNGAKPDDGDKMVERMMKFGEKYFLAFQAITDLKNKNGDDYLRKWMSDNEESFLTHNESFLPLYAQVIKLRDPPYFMTIWSMSFLVDLALESFSVRTPEQYKALSKSELSEIDVLVKFGEDCLLNFASKVIKK